jgi:hypothetical protein
MTFALGVGASFKVVHSTALAPMGKDDKIVVNHNYVMMTAMQSAIVTLCVILKQSMPVRNTTKVFHAKGY